MSDENNEKINGTAANLFRGRNFGFLSTIMTDGSPQVTPTWVDIDDENNILVNTAKGRVKQSNVSRDPRVAISIVDKNNPYHMVSVRGKVIGQTSEGADSHIDKLSQKYLGHDRYPFRAEGEERIILKIKPKKIFHMNP
jgi:PPOX class probable F420-dependent enzyme